MKRLMKLLLVAMMPFMLFAKGVRQGTVSVLLFSDGKPLVANEVKFDGVKTFKTDKDGALKTTLLVGSHQIEIYGKDKYGKNLGYFKKQISVKEGRDTQVIATLSKNAADTINIDTPVKTLAVKEKKVEVATGTGTLKGRILSSQGNTPISGARVFVRGTSVDVRTDANGAFSAKVPSGKTLSISVVHLAYSAQTVGNIRVKNASTVSKTIKLTPASMELEEFIVLAPKVEGSITNIIMEEKKSTSITNIIGSEEFSKKGDGSAAAALKRVTGVTLIDGKSIFVRGLGERYSNVELNSLNLPSPDPTKRVVPLDIFPSSVIGSMKIQKSASADIPAAFGGGYVDIRTKDKSDEDFMKVSLAMRFNSKTLSDVIDHEGSEGDWTGFDNGYRQIPSYIVNHAAVKIGERIKNFSTANFSNKEVLQLARDFVLRDYGIYKSALPFGMNVSIEAAKNYDIDDEHKFTLYGNYKYSQSHDSRVENFYKYAFDANGKPRSKPDSNGTKTKTTSKYSHGGMLNIGYNFLDVLRLKYTKLYTHIGEKNTRVTNGIFGSNEEHLIYHYLDWAEKTLSADQLNGEFDYEIFNKKSKLSFGLEYATASLEQPNNFFYIDEVNADGTKVIKTGTTNFLSKKLSSKDDVFALYLKNRTNIEIFSEDDYIELGLNYSAKDRVSTYQKFYLKEDGVAVDHTEIKGGDVEGFLDQYIRSNMNYADRAFVLKSLFSPADYFDASVDEASFYLSAFMKPYEKIDVLMGLKYVDLTQSIYQYQEDKENPDMSKRRLVQRFSEELYLSDFYPSVSIKYRHDDNRHYDFAISKTYIIPDLREFTSGSYFHPYDVATVQGNPDLNNTTIYNIDFKYSHYFSDAEYIKAGLFFKYLDNPIEDTQEQSSSLPIYSYDNADYAILYGVELDARKNLDFISNDFRNYYVSANFSYTNSEVTLREEQEKSFTTNYRQLQGLSKIVTNVSLGYDSDKRSVSLSYNKMGERIRKVGLVKSGTKLKYPDSYEVPPHLLDMVWIEKMDSYSFKLKIGNILNDETLWTEGSNTTRKFKKGMTFSFGASYKY